MTLDLQAAQGRLAVGDFVGLFVDELGWYHASPAREPIETPAVVLKPIAEYSGFAVLQAHSRRRAHIPRLLQRPLFERAIRAGGTPCMVVYADAGRTEVLWSAVFPGEYDLPAYRIEPTELSGRTKRLLASLCFWDRNPLAISFDTIASSVKSAFEPASLPDSSSRPPYLRRRGDWDSASIATHEELGAAASCALPAAPPTMGMLVSLDTVYSPANPADENQRAGVARAEFIPSGEPPPEEYAFEKSLHSEIARALGTLRPRERAVLELRFGLAGRETRTLERAGVELGVTRERVRQIESRALRKMKHYALWHGLDDYLVSGSARSPWPSFWQSARGRSFRTFETDAERRLAGFDARTQSKDDWTAEERIEQQSERLRLAADVRRATERERDQRFRTSAVLRGASGAIRMTDMPWEAATDFRKASEHHRPPPPRTEPAAPVKSVQIRTIEAVTAGLSFDSAGLPLTPRTRAQFEREQALQSALAAIQLCGHVVTDRRLDGRAAWIHDSEQRLKFEGLRAFGLKFIPAARKHEGAWVRGWWIK